MILDALYNFYIQDKDSIPEGWMKCELSYLIVIDKNGGFLRIRRLDGEDKNHIVPAGDHTNSVTPQLLWDNVMYTLDYTKDKDNITEWSKSKEHEKHLAFVERCKKTAKFLNNPYIDAVVSFYKKGNLCKVYEDKLWDEVKNSKGNISFQVNIKEESVIAATIPELVQPCTGDNLKFGRCLVTGEIGEIVRIGIKTPILGCKSSAKLVSFQKDSGYDSYGKEQGYNAPISKKAEFAYSSAFKKLTERGSKHNVIFVFGNKKDKDFSKNRTYIFWATATNHEIATAIEEGVHLVINPKRRVDLVRNVFKSIWVDKNLHIKRDDRFFIAGLSGVSGRISVVYWNECGLEELAKNVLMHYADMLIDTDELENAKPYRGLYQILADISVDGNIENCPQNLSEATLKSILEGKPYPESLYQTCIRRLLSETDNQDKRKRKVTKTRISILKAFLNRNINNTNYKKIEAMLDKDNTNPGYLCGRLFAVIDRIQEIVNKQNTIRNRYMNAASSTPVTVFPTILNLSNHHAEKLEVSKKFFDNLKGEIISKIEAEGFLPQLDLQDQGRFFIGYYHQRQDLITNKGNNSETTNS